MIKLGLILMKIPSYYNKNVPVEYIKKEETVLAAFNHNFSHVSQPRPAIFTLWEW